MNSMQVAQVREGVLFLDNKPVWYMVEHDGDGELRYLSVFALAEKSVKRYNKTKDVNDLQRDFKVTVIEPNPYHGKTPLSKLAAQQYKDTHKPIQKVNYRKPIFTTVITTGTDTFSQEFGVGFYEHEPTIHTVVSGKSVQTAGNPTGVFLSLDRVTWIRWAVPTNELLYALSDERETLLEITEFN
ncbi:hypothetical protein GPK34_00455 [Secundilactobacillus kimchicus]|uniref:hypothetical protein n=1 Tax=Secundilactobacillus kimchicus TaxID=528209 RepID=UPI001C0243F3|nr:hypothetical protein [Secundilactobacillus kimchicus]MBT9670508.1 hypothetical protein [Secundilactobacillus kimchicus]